MRLFPSLVTLAAHGLMAFFLVASVFLTTPEADAAEVGASEGRVSCQPICKNSEATLAKAPRLKTDAAAALESVQFALSNVGDGGTYVWRKASTSVSGVVQPTHSFRNAKGRICRYLHVLV